MKKLIKKILRESTDLDKTLKGKDLIKHNLDLSVKINDMYDSSQSDKNINRVIVNRQNGKTNLDELVWFIVDKVDYKKDNDYYRIKDLILDLNRLYGVSSELISDVRKVINYKSGYLSKVKSEKISDIGEDSRSDLRYDIVSRGEDFYNKALNDVNIIDKMIDDRDYEESFIYSFPFDSQLI